MRNLIVKAGKHSNAVVTHRNGNRTRRTLLWLVMALAIPVIAVAVSERHFFEVEHQRESELLASIDIALGSVVLQRADEGYLFQAEVVLENDRLVPDFNYRVSGDRGRLGVDLSTTKDAESNVSIPDLGSVTDAKWNLYFGDEVPIDLKLELGGTASTLDMTGIPLRTFRVETEASKGEIRFDEPNPIEMDYLKIESGASELTMLGLANARAERMRFEGGMGKFDLDFGQDIDVLLGTSADIEIGVAAITIRLPEDGPIVLHVPDSWFCSVDIPVGYREASEGRYYSPDFDSQDEVFEVNVEASVGKVTFVAGP